MLSPCINVNVAKSIQYHLSPVVGKNLRSKQSNEEL